MNNRSILVHVRVRTYLYSKCKFIGGTTVPPTHHHGMWDGVPSIFHEIIMAFPSHNPSAAIKSPKQGRWEIKTPQ